MLALGAVCLAQGLHFGLKAGVPVTSYFDTGLTRSPGGTIDYSAATRRYTFGASAEWRLARSVGLELDVLYKRTGYVRIEDSLTSSTSTHSSFDSKGHSWDFPMMAKRRFGRRYLAGGTVLRYFGPIRARGETVETNLIAGATARRPIDTSDPPPLTSRVAWGLTAGGGIEFHAGRIRLLPEVRYARWLTNIFAAGDTLRFSPNQAEFLLGLLF
jgi:hypothetical protein